MWFGRDDTILPLYLEHTSCELRTHVVMKRTSLNFMSIPTGQHEAVLQTRLNEKGAAIQAAFRLQIPKMIYCRNPSSWSFCLTLYTKDFNLRGLFIL